MIKCPHCDHEQESGKFCDSCGLVIPKFQKPEAGVVLGHLVKGRTADSGERLCIECGFRFHGELCPNCGTPYRSRSV